MDFDENPYEAPHEQGTAPKEPDRRRRPGRPALETTAVVALVVGLLIVVMLMPEPWPWVALAVAATVILAVSVASRLKRPSN